MTGNPNQIIFTVCKHCNRAIRLTPTRFVSGGMTNVRPGLMAAVMTPDWTGPRAWEHTALTGDGHLAEPKKPFVDHLVEI